MEPQVEIFCRKECKNKNCSCFWLVLSIIFLAIAFFAGVLVGALTGIIETLTVGAIAVLLIAFTIMAIIAFINLICCNKNDKRNNKC